VVARAGFSGVLAPFEPASSSFPRVSFRGLETLYLERPFYVVTVLASERVNNQREENLRHNASL